MTQTVVPCGVVLHIDSIETDDLCVCIYTVKGMAAMSTVYGMTFQYSKEVVTIKFEWENLYTKQTLCDLIRGVVKSVFNPKI